METKICSTCSEEKLLRGFSFRKDSGKYRNECRTCVTARSMKRYHSSEEVRANHKISAYRHTLSKYGLSEQDFDEMLSKQSSKCAICQCEIYKPDKGVHISLVACVDHNHETGTVRELLCRSCNSGIGQLKDSVDVLKSALAYLERHK